MSSVSVSVARRVSGRLVPVAVWALCATQTPSAAAALESAEFIEHVSIGNRIAEGVDPQAAETVSVNLLSEDFAGRGGGTGHAWVSPVLPVSTGLRMNLFGDHNISGIGGTALTRTRYTFSVMALDDDAPEWVNLGLTATIEVSVANSQPDNIPTWFSYGAIWVGGQSFSVKNYDANGIYNGVFEHHWEDEPLIASFAVGSPYTIDLNAYTHGEGAGVDFTFDSTVFIDPTIEVIGPDSARYRIEYSSQILIPEPASWLLLLAGVPCMLLLRGAHSRRTARGA